MKTRVPQPNTHLIPKPQDKEKKMRSSRVAAAGRAVPTRLKHLAILLSTILTTSLFYFLLHHHLLISPLPLLTKPDYQRISTLPPPPPPPLIPSTNLSHLFFTVASSLSSLPRRAPYFSLWHSPLIRILFFLDRRPPPNQLPFRTLPFAVSADTSRFPYSFHRGSRSALRVARLVKESVDLDPPGVRWFVFGDDDTVFFPENVVAVLGKYDYRKWYYVGSNSESLEQSLNMGFNMAYGGGGFALSAPLAKALARVLDSCLMRYPHLYGSDARISACISELGVQLTREPGFHQFDVRGDLFGMLTTHPLSPLLSLHHLEIVEPIFPHMNQTQGLKHFFKAYRADPGGILQQTVCYDHSSNVTVSVSWGYAVQVFDGNQLLPDILSSQRTFTPWRRRGINISGQYSLDTRDYPRDHCKRPIVFFFEDVASGTGRVWTKYSRHTDRKCPRSDSIKNLKDIKVFVKKLQHNFEQIITPRRQCCDILRPFGKSMVIDIRHCGFDELIAMDP
ncbi:uncharacterized protein LOC141611836 [Silene latifolia]|uniref:uncharacterized protein LOC141611836 n=1 Tax=Silene latifolia TaxID=37657 RepID=UPI003D7734BD